MSQWFWTQDVWNASHSPIYFPTCLVRVDRSKQIQISTLTALSCCMRKSLADTYIIIIATDVDTADIDYIHFLNKQIWFHLSQNDRAGSQYYRSDFETKLDLCAVWTKSESWDVLSVAVFDFRHLASSGICFERFTPQLTLLYIFNLTVKGMVDPEIVVL